MYIIAERKQIYVCNVELEENKVGVCLDDLWNYNMTAEIKKDFKVQNHSIKKKN